MNRSIALLMVIVCVTGAQLLSAQQTLPEPVFLGTGETGLAGSPGEASSLELWASDFNDVVYYLWDFYSEEMPEPALFLPVAALAAAASSDVEAEIPQSIRNNRYFVESVRLTNLAQESFEYGDYDASTSYAEEALRYAQLSDEFVALQLKIKEANDAIAAAKNRMDWASANGIARAYPNEYSEASRYYDASLASRSSRNWDDAIENAGRVINALAYVNAPGESGGAAPLPAQYTVRSWAVSKDCLWNIAGRPWAYGDPSKWRLLYNANKAKMPEPDNPDLIHPGMILDLPSIRGETRQGMWDAAKTYSPLP
jgi:nucleoid-associated protein YgaU